MILHILEAENNPTLLKKLTEQELFTLECLVTSDQLPFKQRAGL